MPIMDLSNLPQAVIGQLTRAVEDYILQGRNKYLSRASLLDSEQMTTLAPFFPADDLRRVKTLVLDGERVEDPQFYSMARMMGIRNLPSFADVAAVTFVDVIVSHESFTLPLLFHEMVHVVQYSLMGSKRFAELYVGGFIRGGSYEEIPLEKNAYQLESRFSIDHRNSFSVADQVQTWLASGKF